VNAIERAVKAAFAAWKAAPPAVQYGSGWAKTPGGGVVYLPPQAQMDYHRLSGELAWNSVVSVCLGWLRDNCATAHLKAGTIEDGKGWQPDDTHELTKWFTEGRPNPLHSWRQVWGATSDAWKVDGNAYWYIGRDLGGMGRAREVYPLPNHCVQVNSSPRTGAVESYEYTPTGSRANQIFNPEEVIHFRDGIDPHNPVMGISRLKRVIRNIAGLNAGETYTAAILRNYGVASYVLVPKDRMGPIADGSPEEDVMRAERRRLERGVGGENAGKPYAAAIPMDYIRIGSGPEELMLDRILDRPEATVCAAMGLNALVTGLPASDASRTYSNLGEASKQAWENALIPMQDAWAESVQNALMGDYDGMVLRWDRTKVEALGEQAGDRVDRAVSLYQAGLLPQNRCLEVAGLDPVEDGDERYNGDPSPANQEMAEKMMENGATPGKPGDPPPGEMKPGEAEDSGADDTEDQAEADDETDGKQAN
jgi:phage portal protein BeeE